MAAQRKISDAHLQLLQQIAEVRCTLPTDKNLVEMTGLAQSTVKHYLSKFARQHLARFKQPSVA